MTPLCFWIGSLSLEAIREVLDGGASFKVHLYPKLSANVLDALTKSTIGMAPLCRTSSGCFYWFCLLELVYYVASLFSSVSSLKAHVGYLQFLKCILQVFFFLLQQFQFPSTIGNNICHHTTTLQWL